MVYSAVVVVVQRSGSNSLEVAGGTAAPRMNGSLPEADVQFSLHEFSNSLFHFILVCFLFITVALFALYMYV